MLLSTGTTVSQYVGQMASMIVVWIEMIVLKYVICPNTSNMKDKRYYSGKLFNQFLKPL